jgi:phage FluMu gp28-like protein
MNSREKLEERYRLLQLAETDPEFKVYEIERCSRSPWHWLSLWVQTHDAHDSENPTKFFPEKDYLKAVVEEWQNEPLLLIAKSRQMMITWLIVALYLWDVQFHPGRHVFFQSKKEEDANEILNRAKFIYDNQPQLLKRYQPISTYCHLEFPEVNSWIKAIPEGADQIRMHTASGIFMDEMAFMPEAEKAFQAAKPTLTGGGRLTAVSSANPSFFQTLIEDK